MEFNLNINKIETEAVVFPFLPKHNWRGDYYDALSDHFPNISEILRFLIVFNQIRNDEIYCFPLENVKHIKYVFFFPTIAKEKATLSDLINSMEKIALNCHHLGIRDISIPIAPLSAFHIDSTLAKSTIDRVFKKHLSIQANLIDTGSINTSGNLVDIVSSYQTADY